MLLRVDPASHIATRVGGGAASALRIGRARLPGRPPPILGSIASRRRTPLGRVIWTLTRRARLSCARREGAPVHLRSQDVGVSLGKFATGAALFPDMTSHPVPTLS